MKKTRVCIYCEKWESGGIESFLYNVLTRMDLTRMEADIVTACRKDSVFTKPLQELGIGFYELSGSQRKVLDNSRQFQRLLEERQYDVVHLNAFQALSLRNLRLAKQAGVPVRIAHSHNTDLRQSRTRQLKLWIHRQARLRYTEDATDLWACSRAAAEFLFSGQTLAERGFRFIPNGIDTRRFRFDAARREAVRRELGLTGKFVVGNVGRLCYQKNQDFLLDIFREILKRRPESRLLLAGEGQDREALEEKARRLGMEEKVLFYGVTDQVEQLLWAMDAFVFPSRFEGLGIVAIEAQAAGLVTVCSERVPREAAVTSLFHQVPLERSPEDWARDILSAAEGERTLGAQQVSGAGFDIADVARLVETNYLR